MGTKEHDTVFKDDEPAAIDHDNISLSQVDSSTSTVLCDSNVNTESDEVKKLSEAVSNINNTPYIYRQDVVRSKSGMTGIVTEVAGDSDSDSSITDDEDDDEDDDYDDDENEEEGGNNNNTTHGNGDKNKNGSNDKTGPLPADQVRVLWTDETESTQNINDLTVVDRGFLHGDFVAAASDPTGQVGVVVDVNISVDLLAPDGSVIKDLSSNELKRVREFTVGDYVVLGPWLGRIDDVYDNVTVLFDDGSVCKIMKAEPMDLKPVSKNMLEDVHFPYYPGQRVKARSSVFKNARWLSGLWKPNRVEGTVTKVTVASVLIYWIASAGCGPDSSTAPAKEQIPKNLKLLSCFTHATWQLGDWCLLPSSVSSSSIPLDKGSSNLELHDSVSSDLEPTQMGSKCDSEESALDEPNGNHESMDIDPVSVLDGNNGNTGRNTSVESSLYNSLLSASKEPVHETWPLHRKKIRKVVVRRDKKARKEENFERSFLIVNTKTTVDVAWQDGTTELKLDSKDLIPLDSPGDHEFVAEQYVVEKASDDGDDAYEARRVGLVKSVNAKERTACVRWLKPVSRPEDPREFEKEEVVSVYELEGHPDYDYCYGDVVVRLLPVFVSAQTASGTDLDEEPKQQNGPSDLSSASTKKEDLSSDEACLDFSDLSWVGNITGLKNGDIEVTWADGMVSTVGPQAIYVVGRADDDDSIGAGSDVSDAASWETVNDDEMPALFAPASTEEEVRLQNAIGMNFEAEEIGENNSGRNPALSVPLAALKFVTRLAHGIFSRGQRNLDSNSLDTEGEGEGEVEPREVEIAQGRDHGEDSSSQKSNVVDPYGLEINKEEEEKHVTPQATEMLDAAEILCNLKTEESDSIECSKDDACSFKRFDIAKDPLDHHFLCAAGQNTSGRKWFKKVQQDWNILQNNLPDGICVRVYEDRMDLLRAVIVGAYGTPYQDGLFFFDFHLPPEYPDVPPTAYYHSGGWRINPNLYEEGKVCLSLLNTWTGRGNEVWDPKSSSILQVLVSLQGLVLNSKPYFNEAGYDKQVGTAEGEKNSLSYNENTFLLNCKTMMYLIRRPPKDFEELVNDHFRRRGYYILKACDAYMKGYSIGSLTKDASLSDKSDVNSTSVGFKLMLAKIVPKLFSALSEVGANCQEFKHLQQS
ncbi:probable ubiquitin-conjugating enzyme E2 23 [Malus sylvestris]|uniref:probable ubiquitin-conjugating enzyme E2 23 n=1 Tax=Malus sylvestris TaxID=3752 RepID=UPI0021ACFCDE|nr:probable ubiquitin-conjugating enzyme E2 23 [Malus sylvestris]XP_050146517.1 probable ubiquitin-conjugating enzyme E2 23 [Malus sylvestris]XP_050146518.1 probable ubiquitin-conjugating enzyme E2 23 [Malus sylvestris]